VMQKLDGTGATVMNVVYDPFGNIISGILVGEYGFSTKPLIGSLDWYYYGFRYYDPETGRWPNRDPIGEQGGINLYHFNWNDPIDWIDPLGLNPCCPGGNPIDCGQLSSAISSLSQEVRNLITQMGALGAEFEGAVNIAAAGLAIELGLAATGVSGIKSVGQRAFKKTVSQANKRASSGGAAFSRADVRVADQAGLNAARGSAKKSLGTAAVTAALGVSVAGAANMVANARIDSADQKSQNLFNTIKGLQDNQRGLMATEDQCCN